MKTLLFVSAFAVFLGAAYAGDAMSSGKPDAATHKTRHHAMHAMSGGAMSGSVMHGGAMQGGAMGGNAMRGGKSRMHGKAMPSNPDTMAGRH